MQRSCKMKGTYVSTMTIVTITTQLFLMYVVVVTSNDKVTVRNGFPNIAQKDGRWLLCAIIGDAAQKQL